MTKRRPSHGDRRKPGVAASRTVPLPPPRAAQARALPPGVLSLPSALEGRLSAGHPWIYRDHVPAGFSAAPGSFVELRAGGFRGFAVWDPDSAIALRVLSRQAPPDRAWVASRIQEAFQLRRELLPPETDAFRLLFGEGDGLPGIVVDVYAGFAVLVTYSPALTRIAEWVASVLSDMPEIRGVSAKVMRRKDREPSLETLSGQEPPALVLVREQGLTYEVDLRAGQKTGLFLDHRDNRRYLRERSRGKSVLNLFCYTGAFSVSAAAGGASAVTSVDIAAPAVAAASRNFEHNGLVTPHEAVAADVFEFLEEARRKGRTWDWVVADPPSFASSRAELFSALRAYRKLHSAALSVLTPGGFYAAASCTAQVSADAFRESVAEGAARVRATATVVHEAAHAADHPYVAGHLEGRYLKFLLVRASALR